MVDDSNLLLRLQVSEWYHGPRTEQNQCDYWQNVLDERNSPANCTCPIWVTMWVSWGSGRSLSLWKIELTSLGFGNWVDGLEVHWDTAEKGRGNGKRAPFKDRKKQGNNYVFMSALFGESTNLYCPPMRRTLRGGRLNCPDMLVTDIFSLQCWMPPRGDVGDCYTFHRFHGILSIAIVDHIWNYLCIEKCKPGHMIFVGWRNKRRLRNGDEREIALSRIQHSGAKQKVVWTPHQFGQRVSPCLLAP